jgi:hypothetical protein
VTSEKQTTWCRLAGGPYCGVRYDPVRKKFSVLGVDKAFKPEGYSASYDGRSEVLTVFGPNGTAVYDRYLGDQWRYRKSTHVP